jgi:hypothetical protein
MKIMKYIKKLAWSVGWQIQKAGIVAVGVIVALFGFLMLPTAYAQPVAAAPSVSITSVSGLICYVYYGFDVIFWFLIAISAVMVILGAFYYVTAAGDSEKISKATKTLTWAAVGIAVALIAYNVPNIVASFFGSTALKGAGTGC